MAVRWAIQNGNFSSTSTWNDGSTLGIPTTGDDVFTNGFTVNMDTNATVNSLNNSARARDIATPAMTANNAPSPFVAAASNTADGTQPFQAFDRNYTTSTFWAALFGNPTWISMDFGSAIRIDGYTIFANSDGNQSPNTWQFQGSNDNSSWTTLHSVTGNTIPSNSTYSIASIGNPATYRYYRLNVTANGGGSRLRITELELYQPGTAALASGGSFNFNTAGVTVSATSTSASLSAGATNLITVTATGGTVTLSLGSIVTGIGANTQLFNYTGACNLTLNGVRFVGGTSNTNSFCINKSSTGLITIVGDVWGGNAGGSSIGLVSTAGSIIINGNLFGVGAQFAVSHTGSGNITVTGNVIGGNGSGVRCLSVSNSSSNVTVNGNSFGGSSVQTEALFITAAASVLINGEVYGGSGAVGMTTAAPTTINGSVYGNAFNAVTTTALLTINGNVFTRGSAAGVSSTSANIINVVGDVYASTLANGISSTNASGIVNLTGNMYNTLGRMAIWCPNIFISNSATTLWRMDIGGGNYKFLYSADSFPNLPSTSDVRRLVSYGPASGLTGTMWVASPSNIRRGVLTDNTVGTADITATDILNFINTSSDPLAVRMRTMLTDNSAGQLISEYNFV